MCTLFDFDVIRLMHFNEIRNAGGGIGVSSSPRATPISWEKGTAIIGFRIYNF
jgi:hypothetical protein